MKGIIAGGSPETVAAGAEILRQGGNAVDAIVAATFATYTSEIVLSSPGGGGFAILNGPDRDPVLYDFFCDTPGRGEDRRGTSMDFAPITVVYESGTSVYHLGWASTAVPGDVAGLAALLEDAGTMPLEAVLQPAIRLAHEGFVLDKYRAYLIRLVDMIFEYHASCMALFAPGGEWLGVGDRFTNSNLGHTLERIAAEGWQTLYTGSLAREIVADQEAHGGLLTHDDLAAYRVIKRPPLTLPYRGHTVYTNPPPSSGGILIGYGLGLFQRAALEGMQHGSAEHIALLAEVQRQTVAARRRDNPEALLDAESYTAWLNAAHTDTAWAEVAAALADQQARQGPVHPRAHSATTHLSAIDEHGLAVGITTTTGESAGYVPGDTGILMNNMLGEEELNPGGFHNYTPGTRMSSMMAPTLVTGPDDTRLLVGSGGAARLRDAIFQLLSNTLDWRQTVQDAVDRPRVHLDGPTLQLEGGFDPVAADTLEARGYTVSRWPDIAFYFGGTHVAQRDAAGRFHGAGDARRGGAVAVVE
ncbi:MAG: gamma-glutamyltransferase family protein [Anaerolineae bacterium]|nr:gamma-glutamyltransferase family protein [Anaerolineae bacterium]